MSKDKKNNTDQKENVQEKVKTVKKSSYSKKKKEFQEELYVKSVIKLLINT